MQIFYWTHLLYIAYWILLILHAPNFWKWFVVPCIIFLIEKFFRFSKSLSEEGKTWVTMGVVLPSKVVSLVIRRPPHFTFKPGDYIFVNIPAIATFEWHPFTISSAPEQSDVISLHIRVVGHWTNKLYEYFEAEQKRLQCTLKGGECPEPQSKYESFHKTMMAARDRARKTSSFLSGSARSSMRKTSAKGDNNNQGYVNYGINAPGVGGGAAPDFEDDVSMSETERSLRLRMRKRDAIMR